MSSVEINQVLAQMRTLRAQAKLDIPAPSELDIKQNAPEFSSLLKNAVDEVSSLQKDSKELSNAYIRGESGVDITRVMVASQKSGLAFQSMVQVRNKLIESYKDIMNMPV